MPGRGGTPHLKPVAVPEPRDASSPDVLVVGAGAVGLACARELARGGARVEVIERLPSGGEASTAAAGMLVPLAETPHPGPFFDACRAARNAWAGFRAEIEEESGLDLDYDDSGAFLVALDAAEEERLEELAQAARGLGEPVEEAAIEDLRGEIPDLSPAARRALFLPGEHRVDSVKLCAALVRAAEGHGVTLSRGRDVKRVAAVRGGVRVEGEGWSREAGELVLAAGAWSGGVPGLPPLPVRPVRGQMVLLGGVEWPFTGIVRGPDLYAVRRGLTGLLVGATLEEAGFERHTTPAGLGSLFAFVQRLLPGLASARVEATWAGLRPGSADGLPLIGRLGDLPVVVASGHYRNGILLAPWTAERIAPLVLDGEAVAELAPFSPDRFTA